MEKFCKNCGKPFNDNEKFCMQCGNKREGMEAVKTHFDDIPEVYNGNKKRNIKLIVIISAIVLAIVAIILIFTGTGDDEDSAKKKKVKSYEEPVSLAVDFWTGDMEAIGGMAPEVYWKFIENRQNIDKEDVIKQHEESYNKYYAVNLEDEYGENVSFSYKMIKETELKEKKLDSIRDGLKGMYDIPKKNVTEGKNLNLEFTIKGDDDEDTKEIEIYVVKIDGDWYAVNSYGDFIFYNIIR